MSQSCTQIPYSQILGGTTSGSSTQLYTIDMGTTNDIQIVGGQTNDAAIVGTNGLQSPFLAGFNYSSTLKLWTKVFTLPSCFVRQVAINHPKEDKVAAMINQSPSSSGDVALTYVVTVNLVSGITLSSLQVNINSFDSTNYNI